MWERTDEFLQTVQEFAWISPFRTRSKASENDTLVVESSEIHEPVPGTQIVTHDSNKHGSFTTTERAEGLRVRNMNVESVLNAEVVAGKAVIYRWYDEEDRNLYIWLAVVHSVIGDPSSPNCQLKVRWCPPVRQYQYRVHISADDTFDTKYTRTTGKTSKYVATIDKQDCLAVNLQLTQSGKLDSKHWGGDHLGSTLKEVAADAIANFYLNPAAGS